MKQRWAVLIDLDQTLVETSALVELRRQRKWQQVYPSFHLTTLFPGAHHFLQEIQKHPLLSPGIVTTSPRPYAEQLVAYHRCQIPVVVAYHDSPRQKPFPDPILKAAEKLGIPPTNCFHIGDAPNDIAAALRASAIPIGLCWDNSLRNQLASLPTFPLCCNWGEVLRVITAITDAKEN
jgi:HAD superfamily hydrolase (TIGR01549 family)